jgi:hypothetical protein
VRTPESHPPTASPGTTTPKITDEPDESRHAGDDLDSISIRDLRPEEIPEAVALLARGMRDNPLHVAAYGEACVATRA